MSARKPSHECDAGPYNLSLDRSPTRGLKVTDDDALDQFEQLWPAATARRQRGSVTAGRFLRGPIPLTWLHCASRLPGKALHVGIAIWFRAGLRRSPVIDVSTVFSNEFGVLRDAKHRAIRQLEKAGLISTAKLPGRSIRVTLMGISGEWEERCFQNHSETENVRMAHSKRRTGKKLE